VEETFDLSSGFTEGVGVDVELCVRFEVRGRRQNLLPKTSNLQPQTFS
jgi:hypothetical protein